MLICWNKYFAMYKLALFVIVGYLRAVFDRRVFEVTLEIFELALNYIIIHYEGLCHT